MKIKSLEAEFNTDTQEVEMIFSFETEGGKQKYLGLSTKTEKTFDLIKAFDLANKALQRFYEEESQKQV